MSESAAASSAASSPSSPTLRYQELATETEQTLQFAGHLIHYQAIAAWQPLFERDRPVAEMFHVAYVKTAGGEGESTGDPHGDARPLTFVFNGGPGAASAYLHMGALGPQRVCFGEQGTVAPPPAQMVDNLESWLAFTDLVFVDPIGTGFSRSIPEGTAAAASNGERSASAQPTASPTSADGTSAAQNAPEALFWDVDRDLKALGEFMQAFLSKHHRWRSPIYIAGESYGGFRVARLAHLLPKDFGIALCGAILISPALEFSFLHGNDYNLSAWITALPSFAAAAAYHGRRPGQGAIRALDSLEAIAATAEEFAYRTVLPLVAMGDQVDADERQALYQQLATLLGLPLEVVERQGGRIGATLFARELLRDQGQVLGVYDASVTAADPFPDRPTFAGSDPTLDGIAPLFASAINSHLRHTLQLKTDLTYHLLSWETFKAWSYGLERHSKQGYIGSVDELRKGMALNPHLQVYVTHGLFDLVTPYFASNHLVNLMRLPPHLRQNLTLKHFKGGHMFYSWEDSRQQWAEDMRRFYGASTTQRR